MASPSTAPASPRTGREGSPPDPGRLLLGLAVIALGTVLLLGAAGVLDAGAFIGRWWPLVIVAAGVLALAETPPSVFRGAVLIGAGAVLLAFTTDLIDESAWSFVLPAAVLLAGVAILGRRSAPTAAAPVRADGDEFVRATGILGGPHVASSAQSFRGAWLTAVLGGIRLDLREAGLDPGGASINATAVAGGVEILVPRGWRISVRCTPVLGGVEDKTDKSVHPPDDAPVLRIDALTVLGGVEIKHEE